MNDRTGMSLLSFQSASFRSIATNGEEEEKEEEEEEDEEEGLASLVSREREKGEVQSCNVFVSECEWDEELGRCEEAIESISEILFKFAHHPSLLIEFCLIKHSRIFLQKLCQGRSIQLAHVLHSFI
jgi:hypothetical protein